MPMTLYFKRAKSFQFQEPGGGTKSFLAQPGPSPQSVPLWVAQTPTFVFGIEDGSIVNLTPPEQMPGYRARLAVEETTTAIEEEPEIEQEGRPQAAFGGQPMVPVPSAPKVGAVRHANARR